MGKCSRNRGKRQQERDVKQGHGPQAQPWTNPLSQPRSDQRRPEELQALRRPHGHAPGAGAGAGAGPRHGRPKTRRV